MGSSSSQHSKSNTEEMSRVRVKIGIEQEKLKQEAECLDEWRRAELIEKHHREQKRLEEEKLKIAREEWQRQENLQQQQQRLEEQRQLLFNQQSHFMLQQQLNKLKEEQLQQEQLQQQQQKQEHQKLQRQQQLQQQQKQLQQQQQQQQEQQKQQHVFTKARSPERLCLAVKKVVTRTEASSTPKSNLNKTCKTFIPSRLVSPNVDYVEWTDIDYLQESYGMSKVVAQNIVKLFKEGNTIPFIARYRKNMTQSMNAEELRKVKNSYNTVDLIKQKANAIIQELHIQSEWTPEFHAFVYNTKCLKDLEYIQSVLKNAQSGPAEKFRELGLSTHAQAIIKGEKIDQVFGNDLLLYVRPNIDGLKTEDEVRNGIICILANMIIKEKDTFEKIKDLRNKHSLTINCTKFNDKNNKESKTKKQTEETKYAYYYNFSSFESNLKAHQILEINQGQARKILNVKVKIPDQFEKDFKEYCAMRYENACKASPLHGILLKSAFNYVWDKMIKLSIFRQTRQKMTDKAEVTLINDIAENVKKLLLTPPVRGKVVIGVNPSRHGCKLAVVSEEGNMLNTETIYPHDKNNPRAKLEAERTLAGIILLYRCTILALGKGANSRETEVFITELIGKGAFLPIDVVCTTIDDSAAAIYSSSHDAAVEFPDLDESSISAISIARRLQDPMIELLKIEPKHLAVGICYRNLPEKQLISKLNEVITEVVSFVGVDVNTAPISLLKRVAGLDESKAKNIIQRRESSGPFLTRNDLKKVKGISDKTFEQCAGFIRIMPKTAVGNNNSKQDSLNYLDQMWIHPEFYDVTEVFLKAANCNLRHLHTKSFKFAVTLFAEQGYDLLAKKCDTSVEVIKIIVKSLLMEKGHDIRDKPNKSKFDKSLTSFNELKVGMVLTGVVRAKAPFGVFVNIGVPIDGLLHNSKIGGITLSVGQKVEVKINNLDTERGRIGLTLIKYV